MEFLNQLYKIDIEIPTQILALPKVHEFRYENAYRRWHSECYVGEKMTNNPSGGLNEFVTERESNSCAFWVVELCGVHTGLQGRQAMIEATISICDTATGYALDKWIKNGTMKDGQTKTRYFVRGGVGLNESGEMEDVLFETVTAVAYGIANFRSALDSIFNKKMVDCCSATVKDKIQSGKYPL